TVDRLTSHSRNPHRSRSSHSHTEQIAFILSHSQLGTLELHHSRLHHSRTQTVSSLSLETPRVRKGTLKQG
ncbi:hypothetical protein A2U01_0089028, partial [Trifolium medium]|nr:hypothetical protein [Trifolium medium]